MTEYKEVGSNVLKMFQRDQQSKRLRNASIAQNQPTRKKYLLSFSSTLESFF